MPETIQQLFDAYLESEKAVISEYSVNVNADLIELKEWAFNFAIKHELAAPVDFDFEITF